MNKKNISFLKSILLTSFWTFLLAELFFAFIYFFIINIIQFAQIFAISLFSSWFWANSEIFQPLTVIIFWIWLILISIITFIEIATIIAITVYDYYKDDHIPLKSLVYFVFDRLKKIFNWKILPIFVFILLLPKEHIWASWLYNLEIPPFIMDWILQNSLYLSIFIVFVLFIIIFVYKSLFLIHILILEKNDNIFSAFAKSFSFTKQVWFYSILKLNIKAIYFSFIAIVCIFLFFSLFEIFIIYCFGFLWNFLVFLLTIINYLENFLFFAVPWVILFSLLSFFYIDKSDFSENRFFKLFNFASKNKTIERWKNIKYLLKKFWKKKIIFVSWIIFVFLFFLSAFFIKIEKIEIKDIDFISHRWYLHNSWEDFIENTMKAIENAYESWANIIEIDIFENKDWNLYLSHDPNLKRISWINREISDMSDKEIDDIILSDWSHIPRLEEVLEFAKEKRVIILIEPKIHWKEKNLYQKVVDLINKYDIHKFVKVHSLSLKTVLEIDKLDPKIEVWYTIFWWVWDLSLIPVDFFSIQETAMKSSLVKRVHLSGRKIYIWTLNETENLKKYLFMWIDWIITDELELLEKDVKKLKQDLINKPQYYIDFFWIKLFIPST